MLLGFANTFKTQARAQNYRFLSRHRLPLAYHCPNLAISSKYLGHKHRKDLCITILDSFNLRDLILF